MKVRIGSVVIGDGEKIAIQSMTNTDTRDVKSTVAQIHSLEEAGCDIIRLSVPDNESAAALPAIKKEIHIPMVADIHFDYRLAIAAIKNGADKVRINPGNIGGYDNFKKVIDLCKERQISMRIGVNSGSLPKRFQKPSAEAMVESAGEYIKICEGNGFSGLVISLKASDIRLTVESCRAFAKAYDYPLHLGITEAGTPYQGIIKSAVGIGSLLLEGIGDTVRVSLAGDKTEEIKAAKAILKAAGHSDGSPELIVCPTCGRTKIDIIQIAGEVEKALNGVKKPIKAAIMGCAVNGPGEAREADIGIAGGDGCALLFKKGEIIRKIKEADIVTELIKEIHCME